MTIRKGLLDKTVACPGCGSLIKLPEKSGTVTCEACDYEYKYTPEIKIASFLKFERDNGSEYLYELNNNITIGKNKRHVITIIDKLIDSIKEKIPIRTAYVSKKHLDIQLEQKHEVIEINHEQHVVNKTVCYIKDNNSLNGTELNRHLIKGEEKTRPLKHGDEIILAPNCKKYVKIEYLEKRVN